MSEYLHGAYGRPETAGVRTAVTGAVAAVVIGTAPVHTIEGGANSVNKPILVNDYSEALQYFGYSDDWASYSLCESIHHILDDLGAGPLVLINVLDPNKAAHKEATAGSKSLTPNNGAVMLADAESIILDSVAVTGKTKGTDYTVQYNRVSKTIVIQETTSGSLGTEALTVTYNTIKPSGVTADDVIGSDDGNGLRTGLHCMKNVYDLTGVVPTFLLAPGWSQIPAVHSAMYANSRSINMHWDAWMLTDIPILDGSTPVTLDTAKTWKVDNGYTHENETVSFPMAVGTDGRYYHLSTIRAGLELSLAIEEDGIPYRTPSNKPAPVIQNLWMGANNTGRVFDETLINEKLVKNGICSAAYSGNRWVCWGAHAANYDQENEDAVNVSETNLQMLFYLCNDFQVRNTINVDEPLSGNDIQLLVATEQSRLDALVKNGMLAYGVITIDADTIARSDMMRGDYKFTYRVTTTPIAKSLTAKAVWVDDGLVFYYGESD